MCAIVVLHANSNECLLTQAVITIVGTNEKLSIQSKTRQAAFRCFAEAPCKNNSGTFCMYAVCVHK